ncbi:MULTISPECIES: TetR/AcrR family transcriptional regulator [Methylosinus]|uniref:TetR family transcriptional regulator n=1 Tax=Methylosinus trichosporium (strain ATCC 35070 / NCIMB 11131 / UNIQEM 75 / OB3b) TaxID=595536 RepID=A0A2D2D0S1_METT3|nr:MULTISPECIES: TetR-like C-terminal domain-containing protein [Methylosinus]ATQ68595.1 TetR family transcriptional regulator [Methylosinus trichosporium OB3b]OBS51019.1 TetR family transcriptional regulator [Methylosinus sp. 3S-1]
MTQQERPVSAAVARRAELRERLLVAGRAAIEAGGLSSLKARDLAAAAGCAVGAIYTVFADLDELILAIGAGTLSALEGALESATGDAGAAADELSRLARGYLQFARAHETLWRALFEHRLGGRAVPAWFLEDQNRLFALIEAPLARLLPQEPPAARARLARSLFSAVHGVVFLGLEEKIAPTPAATLDAELERLVRAFAAGLAAESPAAQSPGSCAGSSSS